MLVCVWQAGMGRLLEKVACGVIISVCEEQDFNMIKGGDIHERVTEKQRENRLACKDVHCPPVAMVGNLQHTINQTF